MPENEEGQEIGEMLPGDVSVYHTENGHVVIQMVVEGQEDPTFGIVLPFRAALNLSKAIAHSAQASQRAMRKAEEN